MNLPDIRFLAGDFMTLDVGSGYDVVVCLETLSHLEDQPAFVRRLASCLRPGGLLLLTTQNRFVLQRRNNVMPPGPGQIRNWVNYMELKALIKPNFRILRLPSLEPDGHRGVLWLVKLEQDQPSARFRHRTQSAAPLEGDSHARADAVPRGREAMDHRVKSAIRRKGGFPHRAVTAAAHKRAGQLLDAEPFQLVVIWCIRVVHCSLGSCGWYSHEVTRRGARLLQARRSSWTCEAVLRFGFVG